MPGGTLDHETLIDPGVTHGPAPDAGPRRTGRVGPRAFPRILMAVDFLAFVVATALAVWLFPSGADSDAHRVLLAYPVLGVICAAAAGAYRPRLRRQVLDEVEPALGSVALASMLVVACILLIDVDARPGRTVAPAWVLASGLVIAGRIGAILAKRVARRRRLRTRNVLIVGAGLIGVHMARRLAEDPQYALRPIGFLDDDPPPASQVPDRRSPVLGGLSDLKRVLRDHDVEHVIVAFTSGPDRQLLDTIRCCQALDVEVSHVPRLFDALSDRVQLEHVGGMPMLTMHRADPHGWQFAVKHAMDRAGAAILLLLCSPLLVFIAAAVKLSSPGPVLYRQRRVGRNGCVFDVLKFRSMGPAPAQADFRPASGAAPGGVEGVDRRTWIGKIIRKTSLDELPQLINVLRGDMSLVGPRPERPEFVELFEKDIARYGERHRVRAGITGWAQVHGLRGQTSLADRIEWDNYYIENWSLRLDLKILLMTLRSFIAHE